MVDAPGPTRCTLSSSTAPFTSIVSLVSAPAVPQRHNRTAVCSGSGSIPTTARLPAGAATRRVSTVICGARPPVPTSQPPACRSVTTTTRPGRSPIRAEAAASPSR